MKKKTKNTVRKFQDVKKEKKNNNMDGIAEVFLHDVK